MNRSLPRPGYAAVTATLALAVALGGTSYAATQLPKNSVTSTQVKNHSLKGQDFKPAELAQLNGPAGPTGPAGPAGGAGLTYKIEHASVDSGDQAVFQVPCPVGARATGGGASASLNFVLRIYQSAPLIDGSKWVIQLKNDSGQDDLDVYAWAVCVPL